MGCREDARLAEGLARNSGILRNGLATGDAACITTNALTISMQRIAAQVVALNLLAMLSIHTGFIDRIV